MADADTGPGPVDQATLLGNIDRTRAELARTVDAISARVNPRQNIDQAIAQARERLDRAVEQGRKRVDRAVEQAGERVSQIDPVWAGVVAAAVALTASSLLLWRRHSR